MADRMMQTSPGPRDGSSMGSPPKPCGNMAMSFQSQDLAGISIDLDFSSTPVSFGRMSNSFGAPRTRNPLAQWYETNDGPWIPKDLAPAENNAHGSARLGLSLQDQFAFAHYRDIAPSECETVPPGIHLPSDSGYGSNGAKRSVATLSVYDEVVDRSAETRSLVGNLTDFGFHSDPFHKNGAPRYNTWGQPQGQSPLPQRSYQHPGKELRCDECDKPMKTNSELKKHRQRHTKPHMCDVKGCNRSAGFSTMNDLDRHKRSVHPEVKVQGNTYMCPIGTCKSKDKIWPRADNFRAHLKRVHRQEPVDDDLERYIRRSSPPVAQEFLTDLVGIQSLNYNLQLSPGTESSFWSTGMNHNQSIELQQEACADTEQSHPQKADSHSPIDVAPESLGPENLGITDASGVASHFLMGSEHLNHDFRDPAASMHVDIAHRDVTMGEPQFVIPGALSRNSERSITFDVAQPQENSREERSTSRVSSSDNTASAAQSPREEKGDEITTDSIPATSALALNLDDSDSVKKLLETLQERGVLENLGYKKESSDKSKATYCVTSSRPENQNSCPTCSKNFGRRCELKKHMKRHEKPYGCTFPGCNKKFGSKNDWKRHENSQHFLLEVWKCDEKGIDKPSDTCGKVNHRRETFKVHLKSNHQLSDDIVERKLESCRVGRNCEARFWCGFCENIVQIKQKGLDAWTERFNHIDDHFAGRNRLQKKQINEWKNVDPDASPRADSSGSDSEEESELSSSRNKSTTTGTVRIHEVNGSFGLKRKADSLDESHHTTKRMKTGHWHSQGRPITQCCQCGEGNSKRTSPQCVGTECQHILCINCG